MRILLRLAWRNVWRNRRRTLIVMLAVALGLMLLISYDGYIAGMKQAIYGNAVRLYGGNIQVHAPGYRDKAKRNPLLPLADADRAMQAALAQPSVISASRRINTGGMVGNREGTFPVTITGIEPEKEITSSLIAQNMIAGRYLQTGDGDVILIGQALGERMEVGVGDRITLTGRATHERMRQRTVTIVGIYDLGLPAIEKGAIYLSLDEAQKLLGLRGQATEVVISLPQVGQEPPVVNALRAALPGYEVDAWDATNPELKQTMEVSTATMDVFGVVVLLIAGIGILNLLLMAVFERTREIGLLSAMGLKSNQIMGLFLAEGVLLSLLGAAAGIVLGWLLMAWLGQVGIDYSQFSDMTEFTALMGQRAYATFAPDMAVRRSVTLVVIAALAALYPAREAAKREPADALHHV